MIVTSKREMGLGLNIIQTLKGVGESYRDNEQQIKEKDTKLIKSAF